jgi:pyruvate/2-oxoglutarate dehydrogenase complex dihydrolipoamide dehydrogenase (E3) component
MAERWKLGGTCLNVGCVPTKALIRSAQVAETVRRAGEFGIDVSDWGIDYPRVVQRARAIIEGFSGEEPRETLARQGIMLLEGSVRFLDQHRVECDAEHYEADGFVIASGSTSLVPRLPGLDQVDHLTSDEALWLETLPKSVVIVGTSIIGCEFASLWAALGVDVTMIGRRLMPQEDPEIGEALLGAFEARGVRLVRGRVIGLQQVDGQPTVAVALAAAGEERLTAEALLLATGRQAQCYGLNLEAAGVRTWERGIAVDETMRTNVPHIWAAGDVTGQHMYTHAGDYAAEVAGWNAANGEPERAVDWRVVPRPVYSIPEVAAIGLLEQEARERAVDVELASVCYQDVSRPIIQGEPEGFAKIIADRSNGQIIGASIVGAQACELISEIAIAMVGGVSAWTVGDTLHPYPTLSEVVRWTADQIGKGHRPAVAQAPGVPVAFKHQHPLGLWPTEGARKRSLDHLARAG